MSTGYVLLDRPNTAYGVQNPDGVYFGRSSMINRPVAIVVHSAENFTDVIGPDTGAEAVASWFATGDAGASYHTLIDSDSTVRCLPAGLDGTVPHTAWHCHNYNSRTLGLSFAMRADSWPQVPKAWADGAMGRAAAETALWCARWGIPPRWITKAQLDSGGSGLICHTDIDWPDRSDPGAGFDRARFVELIAQELDFAPAASTIGDDDMAKLIRTPDGTVWSTDGVHATALSAPALDGFRAAGLVPTDPKNPWGYNLSWEQAGPLLVSDAKGGMITLRQALAVLAGGR